MIIKERKIDDVSFINIDNQLGLVVVLCSFGASLYQIETFDNNKHLEAILLTPNNLSDFYQSDAYFGKTIGRFSGRIKNAIATIDNVDYALDKNDSNVNSLHGGNNSLSYQNFNYSIFESDENVAIEFNYLEKENKLPGDVLYKITYQISKIQNDLTIYFEAKTNKNTIVNLTNHAYFNLSGNQKHTILNHNLKLFANKVTKLDNNLIPLEIEKVNKIMDFTKGHKINKYINDTSLQNHKAKGYDHCFIKTNPNEDIIAILHDKKSHRKLIVSTSYPAIVCYTYNYPVENIFSEKNITKHHAIALECQYIPNDLKNAYLKKDQLYKHYIKYSFKTK